MVRTMPEGAMGRFTDAGDYETSLPDLKTELVVTQPGVFGAQLTWATLPNLLLMRAQETLSRVAYIALPEAPVVVSFATGGSGGLIWNGVELGPGDVVFHSRGEHLHQRTIGPSHWGFLSVSHTFFVRLGSAFAGHDLTPPASGQIMRPLPADLARLLRLHSGVAHMVETRPVRLGHPEVGRAVEHELLEALVTCLNDRAPDDGPDPRWDHVRIMTRLEEVLAVQGDQILNVRELCVIVGVAERILRTCCDAFLGTSPGHYLQLRRLKLARAAMFRADPATVRVGEVARRHGFASSKGFAAAYRLAYGENPSTTLARRKRSPTEAGFSDSA
jgi:AraC-like DNA-binding protein